MTDMRIVAWDTETCLIRPGVLAPELVCLTATVDRGPAKIWHVSDPALLETFESWLTDPEVLLVGQNVAYDMAVMGAHSPDLLPHIFEAYKANRVTDTMIRAKLLDIAAGTYRGKLGDGNRWIKYDYSLEALARRYLGKTLDKDTWRLRYGELISTPLDQWPAGAIEYPLSDAVHTRDLYFVEEEQNGKSRVGDCLLDQFRQTYSAFCLHLVSAWGLRTSSAGVDSFEASVGAAYEEVKARLITAGLVRPNGVRNTLAAKNRMVEVCEAEGLTLRVTEARQVCLDADACEASGDPLLQDYAELSTLSKVLSTDVVMLRSGTASPIHTRFDLAETGRVTSSKPNVQNVRRLPGIRECFVPREGYVFAQADYDGLELRTLAQVCVHLFAKSALADALNSGLDPHLALAASILGISYEEAKERKKDKDVDAARQTAKVANFGFPGGLGIKKLVLFARKSYGVLLTEESARDLKNQWLTRWPEMANYFQHVSSLDNTKQEVAAILDKWQQSLDKEPTDSEFKKATAMARAIVMRSGNVPVLRQLQSRRVRGGATYTAMCNSYFQGLGSDATKEALRLITEACYVDTDSPLFGCRVVNYIHDEFILEVPEGPGAHDAAEELARLMVKGANIWLPDVPAKTEPLLMRYWSKEAKRVVDDEGRLIPWAA